MDVRRPFQCSLSVSRKELESGEGVRAMPMFGHRQKNFLNSLGKLARKSQVCLEATYLSRKLLGPYLGLGEQATFNDGFVDCIGARLEEA